MLETFYMVNALLFGLKCTQIFSVKRSNVI